MTLTAILSDYPDATPAILERLTEIIRRELDADREARETERAAQKAREAQLARLDAMTAEGPPEAVPEPPECPSKVRKGVWAGKSDAEVSAAISKRWDTRRLKAVSKADDLIRDYYVRNADRPIEGFEDIDHQIQTAIDPTAPAPDRDKARVSALMVINNLALGYPYDVWAKPSFGWWLMKQRQ